jgi:hypothetical protein
MRLSADRFKLGKMAADELREAVLERRAAIRRHRDAKGDDRCWVDDYFVWELLEYSPTLVLPPFDAAMAQCRAFYQHRRAAAPDPAPAEDLPQPDADLDVMTQPQLAATLAALQEGIRKHRDVKDRPRSLDDDRALYALLPEKRPADFRLPPEEEFLGEAKAPHAGCPSFWRSHAGCTQAHDLHRWGPCDDD